MEKLGEIYRSGYRGNMEGKREKMKRAYKRVRQVGDITETFYVTPYIHQVHFIYILLVIYVYIFEKRVMDRKKGSEGKLRRNIQRKT